MATRWRESGRGLGICFEATWPRPCCSGRAGALSGRTSGPSALRLARAPAGPGRSIASRVTDPRRRRQRRRTATAPPSIRNPAPLQSRAIRDMFDALQEKEMTGTRTGSALDVPSINYLTERLTRRQAHIGQPAGASSKASRSTKWVVGSMTLGDEFGLLLSLRMHDPCCSATPRVQSTTMGSISSCSIMPHTWPTGQNRAQRSPAPADSDQARSLTEDAEYPNRFSRPIVVIPRHGDQSSTASASNGGKPP